MPQFDFTTYSSQIFWFLLCFTALYCSMHFIILPRIREIIENRKNVIESDMALTHELDQKIESLQTKTEKLRQEASKKYQSQIEETARQATKNRDKAVEEMKEKIDAITKKSRQEIKNFIKETEAKSASAIQNLIQEIKAKILG